MSTIQWIPAQENEQNSKLGEQPKRRSEPQIRRTAQENKQNSNRGEIPKRTEHFSGKMSVGVLANSNRGEMLALIHQGTYYKYLKEQRKKKVR